MSIDNDVKEKRREVQGLDEEEGEKRRRSAPHAKDRRTTPEDSKSRYNMTHTYLIQAHILTLMC